MHVVGSLIGSISPTMNFCSTIGINSLLLLGFLQGVEAGDSKTLTFLPELPSSPTGALQTMGPATGRYDLLATECRG